MEEYRVIRRALITEKSTIAKDGWNKYVFEVDVMANKVEIAKAVEKFFKVRVKNVCVMNVLGKKRRMGKIVGQKRSWKKAVVTLALGNRIEIHEGV